MQPECSLDYRLRGTSAGAPMWAGMIALANQKSLHDGNFNLGFLNPLLYQVGQNNSSTSYSNDFHDVQLGNNYTTGDGNNEYQATPHYDMVTGLGSYNALLLATDLELLAKNQTNGRLSPASNTWYFAEGSVGGSFSEFITLLNPSPTQAATVNITYLFQNKPAVTVQHIVNAEHSIYCQRWHRPEGAWQFSTRGHFSDCAIITRPCRSRASYVFHFPWNQERYRRDGRDQC